MKKKEIPRASLKMINLTVHKSKLTSKNRDTIGYTDMSRIC